MSFTNDPVRDAEEHFSRKQGTRRLQLRDFAMDPIEVNGIFFAVEADASVVQVEDDPYQIEVDVDELFIVSDADGEATLFRLDLPSFRTDHLAMYLVMQRRLEDVASRCANRASSWVYDEEEP